MYLHYLFQALDLLGAHKKPIQWDYKLEEFLSHYISEHAEAWPYNMNALFDLNKRDLERLKTERGDFRKPRIFLYADINQSGNFVLEWSPYLRETAALGIKDIDFKDLMVGECEPSHTRLLWFKNITILRFLLTTEIKEVAENLVLSIDERIGQMVKFLNQNFEVITCSEFKIIRKEQKIENFEIIRYSEKLISKYGENKESLSASHP